jgi:hypothetical protein
LASRNAAQYAYDAVEEPIEGTMITVMKEWGSILTDECFTKISLEEVFTNAYRKLRDALEKTKDQLAVLKKADVVDSGAMGFTCFIEGVLFYISNQYSPEFLIINKENTEVTGYEIQHSWKEGYRYCTECLLKSDGSINLKDVKKQLQQMGTSIVVAGNTNKFRVHIHTNVPADVFEYLHDKGVVIYQKVEDMRMQEEIVNHRKYDIALVTDSIADIPQEFIDQHQIHVIHLDILYNNMLYMDKLTILPERLLNMSKNKPDKPTSSQPNPKNIENLLDYLSTYYHSVIIMTVSKELSGTYNSFLNAVKNFKQSNIKISVINTKQNSGAQGLLVKKCAELIDKGLSYEEIINSMEDFIDNSKILVQVKNLDNMIRSGRLSIGLSKLIGKVKIMPVVTLNRDGKGELYNISFSLSGSDKKIIRHIRKIASDNNIESYNIVHVNNEAGAKRLGQLITNLIGTKPDYIMETSSIVSISAGEGAVAISYLLRKGGV